MSNMVSLRMPIGLLLVLGLVSISALLVKNQTLQQRLAALEASGPLIIEGNHDHTAVSKSISGEMLRLELEEVQDLLRWEMEKKPQPLIVDDPGASRDQVAALEQASRGTWRLELEEAQDLLHREIEKNARLSKEVLDLRQELKLTLPSLPDALNEEGNRPPPEVTSVAQPPRMRTNGFSPRLSQLNILDVDLRLGMAALNVGSHHGILQGMRFAVVRDGFKVGRVRVTDVRLAVAGAVIEEANEPGLMTGDRVVPWKESNGS